MNQDIEGMKLSFTLVGRTAIQINALAKAWDMQTNALVERLLEIAITWRNQTNPNQIDGIKPTDLGTGIFLIPDVEQGRLGALKRVTVEDITYGDCMRRGLHTNAFKWVPHTVVSQARVSGHVCRTLKKRSARKRHT